MSVTQSEPTVVFTGLEEYRRMRSLLGPDDLILLLANITPIYGNTRLQKEVFLLWNMIPTLTTDMAFYPHKFGPYSKLVEDTVKVLKARGFIEERPGKKYWITDAGKNHIMEKSKKLADMLPELRDMKIRWNEWMTHGITTYVYRHYPEYAMQTERSDLTW